MPCRPIRIRVAVHRCVRAHLIAQAYVAVVKQVCEDTLGSKKKVGRWAAHRATEHADGVSNIGP
eukprot:524671-Pleurochrysis_carterae.AAC.1